MIESGWILYYYSNVPENEQKVAFFPWNPTGLAGKWRVRKVESCMKKSWRLWTVMTGMLIVLSGCAGNGQSDYRKTAGPADTVVSADAADSADAAGEYSEADSILRMTFLDTGKSDCIIIETENHLVVNDTADADDEDMICAFLEKRQAERIDYLILSHFDKDHIGSAAVLLSEYEVGCVLMPEHEKESEPYQALTEALSRTGTEERRLAEDYRFTLDDILFTVDAPDEDSYEDDNNYSLITAVTCGETKFLLTGDALKKRIGEFLDSDAGEEHYDLIKMPHHGDYNKKLPDLFAIARPDYVILTAGEERARVEDKTIELMGKSGCRVFYTDEGAATALSDGRTVTLMQ